MPNELKDQLPDLADQKTLEQFRRYIDLIQREDLIAQARDLSEAILGVLGQKPNFSEQQPELFKQYQTILIRSRWIALPILSDAEVAEMFEKYFTEGLAMIPDINLWEKLRAKLVGNLIYEERDKIKEEVKKALERNVQKITSNVLMAGTEKRDPTVGNWILDFTASLGDNMFDRVKESQYFVNSKNTKNLSEEEKDKLKILLDIYRRCRLSSKDTRGIEEAIPVDLPDKQGVIREGQFEPIKSSESKEIEEEIKKLIQQREGILPAEMPPEEAKKQRTKLMQEYLGPEEERKRIHQEETNLEKIESGDLVPIRQVFLEAINQKDRYKAIAALRILTQKGNLLEELRNDEKISELFKNLIKEKYKPEVLADFQRQGFKAPYLSLFLQRVLKNQLGLSEADSARVGIQLENMLVKKGNTQAQGMVFGDLVKGEYAWQEVKDEGTRLAIPEQGK